MTECGDGPRREARITKGEQSHLGFLDGIRAGAAMWVMVAHCMIWGGWYGIPLPPAKIAVDIFMVVSGFLMAHQYRARSDKQPVNEGHTAVRFWVRRYFRIAPVYYLTLIFVAIFWNDFRNGFSVLQASNPEKWENVPEYRADRFEMGWLNLAVHFTFLFGLIPQYSFSNLLPDWSISLELQFYLTFPLLYLLMNGRFWPVIVAAAVGLEFALKRWCAVQPGVVPGAVGLFPEPSFLPLKLSLFVAGMQCAEFFQSKSANCNEHTPPRINLVATSALLIGLLHSRYVFALIGFLLLRSLPNSDGVLRGVHAVIGAVNAVLDNRVMRFLADTSYSVYLCHGIAISFLGGWLFKAAWFMALQPSVRVGILIASVASCTFCIAWVVHRLVEKPGIEIGRRVCAKMFPVAH